MAEHRISADSTPMETANERINELRGQNRSLQERGDALAEHLEFYDTIPQAGKKPSRKPPKQSRREAIAAWRTPPELGTAPEEGT